MNQERVFNILLGPHVSEKTTMAVEDDTLVAFRVARDATKPEVKRAVEQLFEVKVRSVRTVKVKGKSKSFGRIQGQRSDWKKAYVTLEEGQNIDFMGGE